MKTNVLLYVGLFFLLTCMAPLTAANDAELVLFNGKIITVDLQDNIYQAIAVKDGKILQLGTDAVILALAGAQCKMVDLNGKAVTPGLIDSHYHMMYYGAQFWPGYLNIRHPVVTSKADLLQVVGDYAATLQPGEWISGNQGFGLQAFETIDRWELDAVTPYNPAYLRHSSGQYSAVNSAALDSAGITKDTPNPPGSLIMRNEQGEPTGILSHYPAENLVGQHATGYGDRTDEEKLEDIERGQELCLSAGYTSVQDVIVGSVRDIMLYKQYADSGLLKVRLYTMLFIDTEQQADTLAKIFKPINSGRFSFNGWKLAMDGGLAARTTLMYDKSLYAAQISYPYHSQEEMNRMVQTLYNTGLQVAVHVGGDEGIDMTITAFEEAMRANPRPDPRLRIEHGLFPTPAAVQRMKESNIILSTQPQWITWYGDGFREATDEATMNHLLPLKTMLDMGIHIAFGCDVPASQYQEPKWAFKGATMRRTTAGTPLTQDERLSVQEALRIHTMGSAYAGFAENTTGSLEPGKFADMVIWSHDLYTMSGTESNDLAAQMTIVGGEILFDDGKNPVTTLSDRWIAAGDMLYARTDHTAILLNNGKVLVAGMGSRQAEIYDPATDAFTASDSTIGDHQQAATATLLNDGRVLLVGGNNAPKVAEIYDPATDSFSLTGSPHVEHCYHTATLLPDGRVLIAGGQDESGPQTTAVAEIYDPTTGEFSLTDSLNVDRSGHTATLLPDGKVLITGGSQTSTPGHGYSVNSCELYDVTAGTFQLASSMAQPRNGHAATLLNDGRVLISCGAWYVQSGELYDPAAGTWSATGDMTVLRRNNHSATLLHDGKVLLAGGFIDAATKTAELFDPATNTFAAVDSMLAPRMLHVAVRLNDGSVFVTGGQIVGSVLKQCERYLAYIPAAVQARPPKNGRSTVPETFELSQNFPNPFNPLTHLKYTLASSGSVRISVFNLRGEWIKTLIDAEHNVGEYRVSWDGRNAEGNQAGTGVYLVRMEADGRATSRKVLFIK